MPLLGTPGHSQAIPGQSLVKSLLLFPGSWCAQSFVFALQESVSPVLCKFWWLYGGVNGDLLQEGLCHTQVCCTQSPVPVADHHQTIPPQEMLKHSSVLISVGSLGPGVHSLFEPFENLWWEWGLIINMNSPLPPSTWGFSFALG